MAIHPTALIDPGAKIGRDVEIGPYCIVEADCVIGDGCWLDAHVKIGRYTTLGARCRVYMGAYIGAEPQDHRFEVGVVSYTEIGEDTVLREYVTIHRSPFAQAVTRVGSHSLLMAFVHAGHDVQIGNYVTIANQTGISGHVIIEDHAVLSGYVLIHQFCRIGALAMIGGRTIITQDVPPYCLLAENARIGGANVIGLRRAGIDQKRRTLIRHAIRTYFFGGLNGSQALTEIAALEQTPEITHFVEFIQAAHRGVMAGDHENPPADGAAEEA